MASKQSKTKLSVVSAFCGMLFVLIGIAFVSWSGQSTDEDAEFKVLEEESYLEQERKRKQDDDDGPVKESDSGRQWFSPPGYDLGAIKQKLPWTWDTCGLRNASEEIGKGHEEQEAGRVWIKGSVPARRGDFPWFLIIFGGERNEAIKERNGWVTHDNAGCGASLISGHHGVTAGHCYCDTIAKQRNEPDKKSKIYVAAGLKNTLEVTERGFDKSWRLLTNCVKYPFNIFYVIDVAVLTWEGPPYQLTKNAEGLIIINSVCLGLWPTIPYGTRMEFIGSGYTGPFFRWYHFDHLHWLVCHNRLIYQFSFAVIQCRRDKFKDGSVCFGDSGGPLTAALNPKEPNRWFQTGVANSLPLVDGSPHEDCSNALAISFHRPDAVVDFIRRNVLD